MLARIHFDLVKLERDPRCRFVALGLITLLAALLRFYRLGEWSFWIDEIFTINRAQIHYGNLETTLQNIPPFRNWVPLSVILTAGTLNALGTTEWSARLVAAVIGTLSVPVLYFPIKRFSGLRVALIAALLLAVSPWHLYWSQNARFYTSLMLLYSLALFAAFFGLERDRPAWLLLSFGLLYMATSERLFAMFMVPVVLCYLLVLRIARFGKPLGLRPRNLWLIGLPAIAFLLFEVYSLITTGSSITLYELETFAGQANHSPLRLLASIVYRIGVPLICLGISGGVYLLAQRKRVGLWLCSAAWLPPLALLAMAPFAFTVDRYIFVSLPFWIILSAVAMNELFVRTDKVSKILALGILVLVVADSLSQDALYYLYQNGNRPDWRAAFALVGREMAEGDVVVATRPELGHYYLSDDVRWINSVDPEIVAREGTRVWFVIDEATGWVSPDLEEWIFRNAELIKVFAVMMPGKSMSITIHLYDPARASSPTVLSGNPRGCGDDFAISASLRSMLLTAAGRLALSTKAPI